MREGETSGKFWSLAHTLQHEQTNESIYTTNNEARFEAAAPPSTLF
jgi:hypothetical protein